MIYPSLMSICHFRVQRTRWSTHPMSWTDMPGDSLCEILSVTANFTITKTRQNWLGIIKQRSRTKSAMISADQIMKWEYSLYRLRFIDLSSP